MTSRTPISLVFTLAVLAILAFPALSRAAGPQLSASITASPETFQRGDLDDDLIVKVTNSGDAPTDGPVSATLILPSDTQLRFRIPGPFNNDSGTCPLVQQVNAGAPFTCMTQDAIGPGETTTVMRASLIVAVDAPDELTTSVTVSALGASDATDEISIPVTDRRPFGLVDFSARSLDSSGDDYTVAGGHPYEATTTFAFPSYRGDTHNAAIPGGDMPVESVRNIWVQLPPGFVGAAAAAPRCPLTKFGQAAAACPRATQVGTLTLTTPFVSDPKPLYNILPEKGYPAEFAFNYANQAIVNYPQLRPRGGGYGLNITVPGAARFVITRVSATLWGMPSQHPGQPLFPGLPDTPPIGGPPIPFLSNPSDCSAEPTTRIYVDSWEHPAKMRPDGMPDLSDPNWKTSSVSNPPVTGCDDPALADQFQPSIEVRTTSKGGAPADANEPAGLEVNLHFDQSNDPTDPDYISGAKQYDPSIPQAPQLKNATVTLPAGLAISPSAADGLGACSDLASDPAGNQVNYDSIKPVSCPDSSKIGTVTATSPLLAAHDPVTDEVTGPEPLHGDVFLLKPHPGDLPAGGEGDGTYRLLIQINSDRYGLNVKLPGTAVADKATGQLTATFTENPQLPVKDLHLEFFGGPRAALSTPKTCGSFTTMTDLEAWSAPGTPDAHPQSTFAVGAGPNGTPCVSSLAERPFSPELDAGTTASKAGSPAPFVLSLSRNDAEQEFSSLDVTLPPGLTAKLAGVPYCPEAAIAAAKSKSGAAEQAGPSCPKASEVGSLTTLAGPGQSPYAVSGKAYLSGPYKGAPLSFAFITPALAGPFDLGNVVVRAAAFVDPSSAQVTVKADPIPQILNGVPLGIRSIQVKVDKPGFTLNPTNCEAMSVSAQVGGASGAHSSPQNHFQVGDCGALGFKPKLKLSFEGAMKRTGNPAITAQLTAPAGSANIAKTTVILPKGQFIDNAHISNPCTRVQFNAGACPPGSVLGRARAYTPLLDQPLEGPVYFRSNGGERELPDIVADLNGQIHVVLVGFVDSVKASGDQTRVRTRFLNVPDAPVSRFKLSLFGGKRGLIENSTNLCKGKPRKAHLELTAQNGRERDYDHKIDTSCKATRKHGKTKRGGHGG